VPPNHDHPSGPPDHDHPSPGVRPAPTAADFDQAFTAAAASPGIRRVWALAQPGLPPQIEPTSFLTLDLLRHVAQALDLSPGQTLADLGCGRGGPGLWLAREADVSLVGVDFSPVAVGQAAHRASLFGRAGQARFIVGDLTQTGLPEASADAAVSIDAFHFAADTAAAAREVRRELRPGRRLALTNWQPKVPHDPRLPDRNRIDWPQLLSTAGFTDIEMEARAEWHEAFTRVYQVALDLGDPGDDAYLADLQDEARRRLSVADLILRVVITATAPSDPKIPSPADGEALRLSPLIRAAWWIRWPPAPANHREARIHHRNVTEAADVRGAAPSLAAHRPRARGESRIARAERSR
jgi:ubiquinone/menaquinone biosynthesis C-methylase UbiE